VKTEIKIELKYRECCGGLWLRHAGNPQVYCASWAPAMREMTAPRAKSDTCPRWRCILRDPGGAACA